MTSVKSTPRDAQIMAAILKEMGITDYEPRVINQMLEFSYRYVTDVLDDAKVYSGHASKKTIDAEDVKLAVQYKLDHSFTTPPPRDLLMDIARHKNTTPLPLIRPYTGPKLPADRYCLSQPNYRLRAFRKPTPAVRLTAGTSLLPALGTPKLGGATHSVLAKSMVSRLTQPTVTIRPNMTTATMSNPMTPNMPIIRLTTGVPASSIATTAPPAVITLNSQMLKRKRDDDDNYD